MIINSLNINYNNYYICPQGVNMPLYIDPVQKPDIPPSFRPSPRDDHPPFGSKNARNKKSQVDQISEMQKMCLEQVIKNNLAKPQEERNFGNEHMTGIETQNEE